MLSSIILWNCTKEICNSRTLATLTLTTTFDYRSGLSWALKVYRCILDCEERAIIVFLIFRLCHQIDCQRPFSKIMWVCWNAWRWNWPTLTILNSWNLTHSALSVQANQPLLQGLAKSCRINVRKWAQFKLSSFSVNLGNIWTCEKNSVYDWMSIVHSLATF